MWLAWLCRRPCRVTRHSFRNSETACVRLRSWSGEPSASVTTCRSSSPRTPRRSSSSACRTCQRRSSSTAIAGIAIVRARPLLASFSRMVPASVCSVLATTASCPVSKSTERQRRAVISPRRRPQSVAKISGMNRRRSRAASKAAVVACYPTASEASRPHRLARLRKEARAEIHRLITFLDQSDPYVMTELEEQDEREEGGDSEPSLGSFDRMTNQERSYRQVSVWCLPLDLEADDCDRRTVTRTRRCSRRRKCAHAPDAARASLRNEGSSGHKNLKLEWQDWDAGISVPRLECISGRPPSEHTPLVRCPPSS